MKTMNVYQYVRADVTFARLSLWQRLAILFGGRLSQKYVNRFKITLSNIPAENEARAFDFGRAEIVLSSDVATDAVFIKQDGGDGWNRGL